jgi:hypothetical protein
LAFQVENLTIFGSCSGYGIGLENTNKSREHDSLVESAFASILISVEAISVASPTIGLNVLLPTLYYVPGECSWRANLEIEVILHVAKKDA